MPVNILFLLSLVEIVAGNCPDTFAQKTSRAVADGLLAQGVIKKTVRSFYIKPLIEEYQGIASVEGTGFSKPFGDHLRKRGIGLRLGCKWAPYELETGGHYSASGRLLLLGQRGFWRIDPGQKYRLPSVPPGTSLSYLASRQQAIPTSGDWYRL